VSAIIQSVQRLWVLRDRLIVVISGLFCAVACGYYLWQTLGPSSWGPRFACAEPDFNVGEVRVGQTVEHNFVITNAGRQPLKVVKAAPGCGSCLIVEVSDYDIAPGASSTIKAMLRPGRAAQGNFEQRVLVETNSTPVPRVILFLRGRNPNSGKALELARHTIKEPVPVYGLEQAIEKVRVTERVALSGLLHAMHTFGLKTPVVISEDPPESIPALDLVLNHAHAVRYFGEAPLVSTRYGVRCRVASRRNADLQPEGVVHAYQLLALLAMHGVPLNTKLTTAQGKGQVMDLLADALVNFSPTQEEVEWATTAFALYVAPQSSWQDKFGKTISFNDLAQRLLDTPFDSPGLPCAGVHLLQSLTVLFLADRQAPILSDEIRHAVRDRLQEHALRVVEHQRSTGAISHLWYLDEEGRTSREKLVEGVVQQRLGVVATGHHLEWLILLPDEMRPRDEVFARAGSWLFDQLRQAPPEEIVESYCPYSHAAYMAQRLCVAAGTSGGSAK
jgi:hypothetical protein